MGAVAKMAVSRGWLARSGNNVGGREAVRRDDSGDAKSAGGGNGVCSCGGME